MSTQTAGSPFVADLVETAVASDFTLLVAALTAVRLVEMLKGPGPFTLFAPSDEAFDRLPPGTLDNLLRAENLDTLRGILRHHVVAGRVPAAELASRHTVQALDGRDLDVATTDGAVTVGAARLETTDIVASNGLIHVVDTVILPA